MPYTTYYGTASNSFAGIKRPTTAPVAGGASALYNSDTNLANFAASQVPFWVAATAYSAVGEQVLYNNQIWAVVASSTGVTPGSDPDKWALLGTGGGGGGGTITLTGDVTGSGTSTFATTIAANAVTNAKAAQMATLTLKGNNTGSTANASDLSVADVSTMLGLSSYLPLSGGTMTGHIELYGTASGAQAVSYSQVSTMLGSYLPLAGGTMTGHIDLYGTASGVQAISYAQVASMVKGAVAQVGYYHTDTTVTSTPASGKMTWNNATQISATSIYINLLDGDGTDFFVFYELVGVNDTILIQDRNDSDNYQLWKVTATPTYASSVFTFAVTLESSGGTGTTNLPNNHDIFIYTNRAAVPTSTDQLPEGTTNLYFTSTRAQTAVAQPAGQVAYGSGTGVTSSSNLVYSSGELSVLGGTPSSGSAAAGSADTAGGRLRLNKVTGGNAAVRIDQTWNAAGTGCYCLVGAVTDTASTNESFLISFTVGSATAFEVSKAGALNLGVNSASRFANAVGPVIALAAPSTPASTAAVAGSAIIQWDNTAKRLKTVDDAGSAKTIVTTSDLVKGATSNQIIKANAAGSYAEVTSTYTVATADANSYLRVGSGTFTITIPADTLGAALESNSQIMIPWRKIGTGTTTFAVSGSGATLTILGGGTLGTALTGAAGVIVVESTTVATITGTL